MRYANWRIGAVLSALGGLTALALAAGAGLRGL
jgi:hypothetical protein